MAKMSSMTSSKFTSGMDRRSPEDDFPRTFPKVELPSEFPSKFQAASAADKAIYRVTIQVIPTPDQASKRTERTEVEYPGGV